MDASQQDRAEGGAGPEGAPAAEGGSGRGSRRGRRGARGRPGGARGGSGGGATAKPRRGPAAEDGDAALDEEGAVPAAEREMPPRAMVGPTTGTLRLEDDGEAYVFTAGPVQYRVRVGAEAAAGRLVVDGRLDNGEWHPLLTGGGMFYRTPEAAVLNPDQAAGGGPLGAEITEFRHSARGRILTLRFAERFHQRPLRRSLVLRLAGRGLSLTVSAPGAPALGNYCGFTLGPLAPEARAQLVVPGTLDPLFVLPGGAFFAAYLDRWVTTASAAPAAGAFYRPNTDGRVPAMADLFYLALAEEPLDVLPAVPSEPAPFRDALARRAVLDVWSEASYAEDAERLERLSRYGLRDLVLIYRNWQQYGYGRRPPCAYPAARERGSNQAFRQLVARARELGWYCALLEEYAHITEDSPYWDKRAVAHTSHGQPRPSPAGGFAIAADKMLAFARLESTQIRRNYRPDAVFAGAHVGWHPEEGLRQVDSDADNRGAASLPAATTATRRLLEFLRAVHGGPLLGGGGEGSERFDTQWTGVVDAAERPLDGGAQAPVIVDYEWRCLNPVMLGFGAGVYPRFFGGGPVDTEKADWDLYRATEVAFGRIPYLGVYGLTPAPEGDWVPLGSMRRAVTEYFMLRALQERALSLPVEEIRYRHGEEMLTLREALAAGLDLTQAQLWRRHAGELEVWVNRHPRAQWPVRAGSATYLLPPNGWLAAQPAAGFLTYSALVAGNRVDVCQGPGYSYLDVRGDTARRIEGITSDGATLLRPGAVPDRRDVLMVASRSLSAGEESYRLSERGDLGVRHLGLDALELWVLATESDHGIQVTLPRFWPAEPVTVEEWLEDGWHLTRQKLNDTKQGLQLPRARPGARYRLRATE